MALLFKEHIKGGNVDAFEKKVIEISQKLGIDPNWLMIVMKSESEIDSKAQNNKHKITSKITGLKEPATGLIQFTGDTARGLKTTIDDLYKMSNLDQLDYVYKYYKRFAFKINSVYDLYLVTFFPIAVGKPDDWVFKSSDISKSKIAEQNPAMDYNKDGQVTIAEFKRFVKHKIPANYENAKYETTITRSAKGFIIRNNTIIGIFFLLAMLVLGYYYYSKYGFNLKK